MNVLFSSKAEECVTEGKVMAVLEKLIVLALLADEETSTPRV